MGATNNGGPAFPVPRFNPAGEEGMALRDYFAAKAMAGILAGFHGRSILDDETPGSAALHATAGLSYEIADAMLAAREDGAA